jgi:hypothetical protein
MTDIIISNRELRNEELVQENKNCIKLIVGMPKKKLERHKYKCIINGNTFIFKSKKDFCNKVDITRTTANRLIGGEIIDGVKVYIV